MKITMEGITEETIGEIMNTEEFLKIMDSGEVVVAGSEVHQHMTKLSFEAMKITSIMNQGYHEQEELRQLFSELIGQEIDEGFKLFPPFYTDCGKNIHIGKNVFINSCCQLQDQDGIIIGDGTLIGHSVVLATLNHDPNPEKRKSSGRCRCYKRCSSGGRAKAFSSFFSCLTP